jgi:hypothetical protein
MLLALIAAVVMLGVLQGAPRVFAPTGTLIFPELAAIEVSAINLYDPTSGTALTMSRGGDGRWTEDGTGREVSPALVSQLAQTLVRLSYSEMIALEADTDLEDYGFSPAGRLYIEFLEVDGTLHAVAVGDLLPDRDAGYYALVDDRPHLYVIPRGAADFLLSQMPDSSNILP